MKHINKVHLTREIIAETIDSLRYYGNRGCEGLVLWLGHINDDGTCRVKEIMTPPQDSIKSNDGVGYFVSAETLFSLNKLLSSSGLRLLAQVHSHPGRAYHSSADDKYCIVTLEGGFSIVVPDFGFGTSDLRQWATYRLTNGSWERLSSRAIKTTFAVDGEIEDNSENSSFFTIVKKLFN